MNSDQFRQWCRDTAIAQSPLYWRKPLVMGILNATPNSFSDGGLFLDPKKASQRARELLALGADIIDVGGESSNPYASPVSLQEEIDRVIPVIEQLRAISDVCISIDTYKPEVMQAAVAAGASFINDIKALTEPSALSVAASQHVPVCLMHMRGTPVNMQDNPQYENGVMEDIHLFLKERIEACLNVGILHDHLILDPGFGFGKSVSHNLLLLNRIAELRRYNCPVLLGVSRKSTIGAVLQKDVGERLSGGLAITVYAALQGVGIFRTHDVDETCQALNMVHAIVGQDE